MEIDEIYGYITEPFSGQIHFVDKFQYLNNLNLNNDYSKQIQEMIYTENEIENLITDKYKKYKDKEIQSPVGGNMDGIRKMYENFKPTNINGIPSVLCPRRLMPIQTKKFAFRK